MFDFNKEIIVITGAAGNLGQAVVRAFHDANGTVCALDHRVGRIKPIFSDLSRKNQISFYENLNINDKQAMIDVGKQINQTFGKIDIVVNTVGGFAAGERVDEITVDSWEKMMNLNVHSLINTAAAFVPYMIEKKRGKFITIGSRAALSGGAKMGAYSAAKGALLRLTESMAAELKTYHIQVNCVLPGTIDTTQNRAEMQNSDFSKWVTPEQVAQVIMFLSSAEADGITGAALPVFGG
jgi:NAD(P)-dependent dehydrogenase (short-subunit alcohol dehydrogenase family)